MGMVLKMSSPEMASKISRAFERKSIDCHMSFHPKDGISCVEIKLAKDNNKIPRGIINRYKKGIIGLSDVPLL